MQEVLTTNQYGLKSSNYVCICDVEAVEKP